MSSLAPSRDEILGFAEEHGAKAAGERYGVPASTIRSWRRRKVEDHRARDDDQVPAATAQPARPGGRDPAMLPAAMLSDVELQAEIDRLRAELGAGDTAPGHQLVDVMIPDGGWDGGQGCESKTSARARLLERFVMAGSRLTEAPLRDLGCPSGDAQGLAAGDLLLIGSEQLASYSDAIFEVVGVHGSWRASYEWRPTLPRPVGETFAPTPDDPDPRAGWALVRVKPARLQDGTALSADRTRIEHGPKAGPHVMSTRERLALWDTQPDPWREDRERWAKRLGR